MAEFEDYINKNKDIISVDGSKDRNSLVFAFVGDALFSLFVRTHLAKISTAKAGVLQTKATKFVRASYQKKLIDILHDGLSEEEKHIVTTSRNAKTNNVAKNSNLEEYKKSTSFEALLGYLYMTNQNERLFEILGLCKIEIEKDL
ncbi:MAG: Mini-ribonuclease 3 [Clostridia bacterium]|nr:Mini-ribonuclease 3 [Clostridia bacterium]